MKIPDWVLAGFTFSGTVIGAGVLGLPYALSKPGFLIGSIELISLGLLNLFLALLIGEISLRTKENHQMIGLAEKYLGKKGFYLMAISILLGFYGALLAYMQGCSDILFALFSLPQTLGKILLLLALGTIVYLGLNALKFFEGLLVPLIIIFILSLSALSFLDFNPQNLLYLNSEEAFYPVGVLLFAFAGAGVIPEIKEMIKRKRKLKKAIYLGMVIPIFLYFIFCLAVIGALDGNITEIATIGLGKKFGYLPLLFGNLFALLAMATSFISLATAIKRSYIEDFGFGKNLAFLLAISPCLLSFLNLATFIQILGITGNVTVSLFFILSILIFFRAKEKGERKPEFKIKLPKIAGYALILFFVLVLISTLFKFS